MIVQNEIKRSILLADIMGEVYQKILWLSLIQTM